MTIVIMVKNYLKNTHNFLLILMLLLSFNKAFSQVCLPPGSDPGTPTVDYTTLFNETYPAGNGRVTTVNPTGGGTDKSDISFDIDAHGAIQIRYNGKNHYFNNPSTLDAYPITHLDNDTYNGTIVTIRETEPQTYAPRNFGITASEYGSQEIRRKGTGTAADPWKVKLEYDGGGVVITEIITYVDGEKFIRRDKRIVNNSGEVVAVYEARNAAFNESNRNGYGVYATNGIINPIANPDNTFNGNPNFLGVSNVQLGATVNPNSDVVLGLIEVTPWTSWNTGNWSAMLSSVPYGTPLNNHLATQASDIGFNVSYGDIANGSTKYVTTFEAVTQYCKEMVANDDCIILEAGQTSTTSILDNDTIGTDPATDANTNHTTTANVNNITLNNNGTISANNSAVGGSYGFGYKIYETPTPPTGYNESNQAWVNIIIPYLFTAEDDEYNDTTGSATTINVLDNDSRSNGVTTNTGLSTSGAGSVNVTPVSSLPTGFSLSSTGILSIPANLPEESIYTITYRISDKMSNYSTTGTSCATVETQITNRNSIATITVSKLKDTDKDGIPDITDIDDDNDGILDTVECNSEEKLTNGGLEGPQTKGFTTELNGWQKNESTGNTGYAPFIGSGTPNYPTPDIVTVNGPNATSYGYDISVNPYEGSSAVHAATINHAGTFVMREGIRTTVNSLVVGQDYTISFKQAVKLSNYYGSSFGLSYSHTGYWKIYDVTTQTLLGQSSVITATTPLNDINVQWNDAVINFTATATSITLDFVAVDNANPDLTINNTAFGIYIDAVSLKPYCEDADNDNIPNHLDLDADGDGIPDNIEAQYTINYRSPNTAGNVGINGLYDNYENADTFTTDSNIVLQDTDGDNTYDFLDTDSDNDGKLDSAESGLTLTGNVGINGLDSASEMSDDYTSPRGNKFDPDGASQHKNFPDEDMDALFGGDVDYRDATKNSIPIITQVYHNGSTKCIEITNPGTIAIPANSIKVVLFKDKSSSPVNEEETTNFKGITEIIEPNQSITICNTTPSGVNITGTPMVSTSATDFDDNNDYIVVTYIDPVTHLNNNNKKAWEYRFDVVKNFKNNTSYVRSDEVVEANKIYDSNEWVSFINTPLSISSNVLDRYQNSPTISEITNANTNKNIRLGEHYFGKSTLKTDGTWENGKPDRSRRVLLQKNATFNTTNPLKAKSLEITNNSKIVIDNSPAYITNGISTIDNSELRLINKAQLIQSHNNSSKITGNISLFKDQYTSSVNNPNPTNGNGGNPKYKSMYWSSPVSSETNSFKIANVLYDGTSPTTATSTTKLITFTNNWDGDASTSPIKISKRWLGKMVNALYWTENIDPNSTTFNVGEAWNMKSTTANNQNFTFKGKPNDGVYEITNVSAYKYFVLGNPYPSAIDGTKFLKDNENVIDGALYFYDATNDNSHYYEDFKGGYSVLLSNGLTEKASGSTKVPTKYLTVGQGFLTWTKQTGLPATPKIIFNNSQRIFSNRDNGSTFIGRNNNSQRTLNVDFPVLRIAFEFEHETLGTKERSLTVAFNGKTNNYESGHDAYMLDKKSTDLCLKLNDNTPLVISSIEDFNQDIEIPLILIVNKERSVKFKLLELHNFPNTNIYLKDKTTNQYYNISNTNVNVTMDLPQGTYNDRFFVVFKNQSALSTETVEVIENLNAFVDTKTNEIVIDQKNNVLVKEVKLFNLLGQEVAKWHNNNKASQIRFKKNNINSSIYILKLKTETGKEFSKKLVIE